MASAKLCAVWCRMMFMKQSGVLSSPERRIQMVSRYYVVFLVAFFGVINISFANESELPPIKVPDQIRLREAIRFVHETFDSVWSNGPRPNFELLFIDDSIEYLINHEGQPPGFGTARHDPVLERPVMARQRTFPVGFLATFPAFSGHSTILVGRPENTLPKISSAWIATLAHERLHQIQDACPGMGEKLTALDLAGKDATGMWMLNYPFPYDSVPVGVAYDAYMASLVAALHKRGTTEFPDLLRAVVAARDRLRSELSEKDYRYMAFQLWKEGIARYSEFMIPHLAARWYVPAKSSQNCRTSKPSKLQRTEFTRVLWSSYGQTLCATHTASSFMLPDWPRDCYWTSVLPAGEIDTAHAPEYRHTLFFRLLPISRRRLFLPCHGVSAPNRPS